ncbi:unnamed protein product, partial [Rotaria magnacalcarata]
RISGFSSGYDNSFLVVDSDEAWVIETCDRVWVAKQIKGNIPSIAKECHNNQYEIS